jgi:hypothetical protein
MQNYACDGHWEERGFKKKTKREACLAKEKRCGGIPSGAEESDMFLVASTMMVAR